MKRETSRSWWTGVRTDFKGVLYEIFVKFESYRVLLRYEDGRTGFVRGRPGSLLGHYIFQWIESFTGVM